MIHFSRWKTILILGLTALAFIFAFPNILPQDTRDQMAETMPAWVPTSSVNLGLDLQGGSHLLLQVDIESVIKEQLQDMVAQVRSSLREDHIRFTRLTPDGNGFVLTLQQAGDMDAAKKAIRDLSTDYFIDETGETSLKASFSDAGLRKLREDTVSQSIEIVRRRIDETGTNEPVITKQGDDRIVVQLPGLGSPARIKELLGKTAKLTFHLVDMDGGVDTTSLPMRENPEQKISIKRRPSITGEMLTNAAATFQQGQPVVSFRLNGTGAKRFCKLTREHTNEPFAIVLDEQVVSAPNINEPICGGQAIISGRFTVQETADTALLLRAGALPAPLKIIEERTVGPTLGRDSVEAGKIAGLVALGVVLVFMFLSYGLFGFFAAVALVVNMIMIFAILSMLGATLTLPGIGGIILTIGMAVDANVLIFERIREEMREGRTVLSAIDAGYKNAMSTIVDANITTLIAAVFLYSFGSGPVRGFAVTLTIGIVTSMFSAIWLTRLMVATWLGKKRPSELHI
ncbi:MAG: protein translocase subunit SecD [Pseudobdellovibrionaceae bacterium]